MRLRQKAALQVREVGEGPYLTFSLEHRLLVWPHFLWQLTEPGVILAADHLVTLVLLGELAEEGLDDATPQTKHRVPGGLFLNVVV